jgi:diaminohydroxyphosphoribosylaminopyrimidine deaminase/5-amino-6-(5-phosphoribosylamino)uracil reductase
LGGHPHLQRAYELARAQHPHPNPRVGAVVVSATREVVGEGAHVGPGDPHAEVVALDAAGEGRGATVYVSLEPCSHMGRTPPCADRLISEGVARVVVGAIDPDSRVAGSGIARLRDAGIEVEVVEDPEARAVDPGYFRHRETGLPLVTLKYAMTLDGSSAAADASSQWITSEQARADAHGLRSAADAVVVGAGTLRNDDPRLDVRLPGYEGHQPRPVIIAGQTMMPTGSRIWERDPLVISSRPIDIPTGELVVVDGEPLPDPVDSCRALAEAGYYDVLLEGGPTLAGAWWRAGIVQRGVVYLGAKMGGGAGITPLHGVFSTIEEATSVVIGEVCKVGEDLRIDFEAVE